MIDFWYDFFLVLNTKEVILKDLEIQTVAGPQRTVRFPQNSFFCVQQNKEIKGLKLILSKWRYKNKTIWQTDDRLFIFVWIITLLLIKHR